MRTEKTSLIDQIILTSLHNRTLVVFTVLGLLGWGTHAVLNMPVDVFPDLTAPKVTIVAEAHGMAPEEIERLITFPLEAALTGASNVRRVRSSTSIGVAVIWVEFEWDTDIYIARQIVTEKINLVQPSLPSEISPPVLAPISSIMGEILFIGLSSETISPKELRTLADWDVRRRLLAVPGVSQVIPIGGEVLQFQVVLRPADLWKFQISIEEVLTAVRKSNQNVSAGFFEQANTEYLLYGIGRAESVAAIGQGLIATKNDIPIRIADVADVNIGHAIKRGDGSINGKPGVIISIQKQPKANTLALSNALDQVLSDIETSLPEGVVLNRSLLNQADFIQAGVQNVTHALRDGAILVMLIVGLFLFSGRATLITALAIPISLLVTVLVLKAMGISLNTMTLGGMAIAVGALVDDAIIDVENVVRRLRLHLAQPNATPASILHTVFLASKEIRSSIVFATLIIILVFLPLFFLSGVEGRLLQPLGIAYVMSLATSLLVALTITPVLCFWLLPKSKAIRMAGEPALTRWLRKRYDVLLAKCLGAWPLLVAFSIAGTLSAVIYIAGSGRTFLPPFNEGSLTISAVTLAGTSLQMSNQIGKRIEAILLQEKEVVSTARRTGRAELDEHAQSIHSSELEVRLTKDGHQSQRMLDRLREQFATIAGTNIVIGQPITHRIDHMISGTRANIAVKIFGHDLSQLQELAKQVEREMESISGVVDLAIEDQASTPVTTIRFDREELALYGLTIGDISESLETAFYGQTVSRVFQGPYAFDLVVRFPEQARESFDVIAQTQIPTPSGAWVPLNAVAHLVTDEGPNQISRENGTRKIVVMCNVGSGAILGDVVAAIQKRLGETIILPDGYYLEYGGQFEAAEQASQTLLLLGIGVVFGIFFLLYAAFNSLRDTVLVMLNLPLALMGGVIGLYVLDGVLSIAVIIGFITLFGIATRNGIMMVTHIRHLRDEEGIRNPREAVIRGASERLVPILMTALASGLGLLPLASAMGEPGSEIQAPMAVVILFGLLSATLLNMLVVPVLMLRFGSVKQTAQATSYGNP